MRQHLMRFSAVVAIVLALTASLAADRVRLRSGKVIDGSFVSADTKFVRLLLDNESIADVAVADIILKLPAETRLQFTLSAAVTVQPA